MTIIDRAQLSEKRVPIIDIYFTYGRRINLRKYGEQISGSIKARPPEFNFAHFLDSEALSKTIYHSLGCK